MGQGRPVCLALGALGSGPGYVDAGVRYPPIERGLLGERRS